jgi:hypothetical protein
MSTHHYITTAPTSSVKSPALDVEIHFCPYFAAGVKGNESWDLASMNI